MTPPALESTAKTAKTIAAELRRLIVAGAYADGDTLSPTNQLMQQFGVSRPTLRAAFRILEGENLLRVTQGSRSGVRVYRPNVANAARVAGQTLQASGGTLGHLYQAQLAFEPFAARLLAERQDARDIARLRAHLAEMRLHLERGAIAEQAASQTRFHELLVDLTGNTVLSLMAGLIANVLEQHQRARAEAHGEKNATPVDPEFRSRGVRSMAKLLRLIEAGDGPGAESHWREHLANSTRYWMSVFDPYERIDISGSVSRTETIG